MRKQFVLDKKTNKLLKELASYHGGNRSLVVRHAIQVYSDIEDRLEEIETNPAFQAMMAKSAAYIKASRVIPHEEVVRRSRARTAKGKRRRDGKSSGLLSFGKFLTNCPRQSARKILEHLKYVKRFPRVYPVRSRSSRFRRHRWWLAGNWLAYYRVVENTVYIAASGRPEFLDLLLSPSLSNDSAGTAARKIVIT